MVASTALTATRVPLPAGNVACRPAALGHGGVKLAVRGITKSYGSTDALKAMDLEVRSGELLTVLGPSGSGKTTLLQVICGLVEPTAGRVFIDGADHTHTPVNRREIGMVFQSYALFPHLTVSENVAFPLEMRKLDPATQQGRVREALEMVGLDAHAQRFPHELSGGQQQRVALARCLVYRPALILMDEPLGALDRELRETVRLEIKRLHRQTGATMVLVTHDLEEALSLSDRICVMRDGRAEQVGTPREIYERPRSTFVAGFVGIANVLRGRLSGEGALRTSDGTFPLPRERVAAAPDGTGALMIRPEHLKVEPGHAGTLTGRVIEAAYAGAETRLLIALPSGASIVGRRGSGESDIGLGDAVSLCWDAERAHFMPA